LALLAYNVLVTFSEQLFVFQVLIVPPLHLRSPVWFDLNFNTIISMISELPSSGLSGMCLTNTTLFNYIRLFLAEVVDQLLSRA